MFILLREFWRQREKENWVNNTGSPELLWSNCRQHGVKCSVGPTLDNVGIQPSAFYAKCYQVKEIALKC